MKPESPIHALACDYDETLASAGKIGPQALQALARLKTRGGKIILVTGRELDDLRKVCPHIDLFDFIVAENGAVLFRPATAQTRTLAAPPPDSFVQALRKRGVKPLSVGLAIVATIREHFAAVQETMARMALDLDLIFNRSSLMMLPPGVNKGTGLRLALDEIGLLPQNVVGVGDAENDDSFLAICGYYVAVANAIPTIQKAADLVTDADQGAGVVEVIDRILAGDLWPSRTSR
jgi:hydroxymethylpyrimidine pyrophosphatase-like HAD family hydrolase